MNKKATRWTENNSQNGRSNLSVTLNVNGLNSPTKRYGVGYQKEQEVMSSLENSTKYLKEN